MTAHRALNTTLAIAAIVGLVAVMQNRDAADEAFAASAAAQDARFAAIKARREEMARVEFCLKSQGPQSYPIEQEDGSFRCFGKRGQRGMVVALQVAAQ